MIVDSVGGHTLEGSIEALAYRGRIAYVGSAGRDGYRPNVDALRPGNKTLIGIFLGAELVMQHAARPPHDRRAISRTWPAARCRSSSTANIR